jgi:hypothetical protein
MKHTHAQGTYYVTMKATAAAINGAHTPVYHARTYTCSIWHVGTCTYATATRHYQHAQAAGLSLVRPLRLPLVGHPEGGRLRRGRAVGPARRRRRGERVAHLLRRVGEARTGHGVEQRGGALAQQRARAVRPRVRQRVLDAHVRPAYPASRAEEVAHRPHRRRRAREPPADRRPDLHRVRPPVAARWSRHDEE